MSDRSTIQGIFGPSSSAHVLRGIPASWANVYKRLTTRLRATLRGVSMPNIGYARPDDRARTPERGRPSADARARTPERRRPEALLLKRVTLLPGSRSDLQTAGDVLCRRERVRQVHADRGDRRGVWAADLGREPEPSGESPRAGRARRARERPALCVLSATSRSDLMLVSRACPTSARRSSV
jgi:hypothetical protein